jgi:putative YhbY family RNA-binding protein
MLQLSSAALREMRARAHALNPVVSIAEKGLSAAILKEIDANLNAHELIKIRVYGDSREVRIAHLEKICSELGAAAVQHIGKLLVVYRPAPAATATVDAPKSPKPRRLATAPHKTKRSFQA